MISSSERPASSGEGLIRIKISSILSAMALRSATSFGRRKMPLSVAVISTVSPSRMPICWHNSAGRVIWNFGSMVTSILARKAGQPHCPHYASVHPFKQKRPRTGRGRMKGAWRCPTFTWGDPTLSSAMNRFTVEFGMGSGGSSSLWSPGGKGLDDSQRSIKQKV